MTITIPHNYSTVLWLHGQAADIEKEVREHVAAFYGDVPFVIVISTRDEGGILKEVTVHAVSQMPQAPRIVRGRLN